jgi:hypothetical protein
MPRFNEEKCRDSQKKCQPRGEVLIGGPTVTLGYYTTGKNTEEDEILKGKNATDYIAKEDEAFNRTLAGRSYKNQ